MNPLRQLFSLPINDIRRWDFIIALIVVFSTPIFYSYKFFSENSEYFLFIKLKYYDNASIFAYYLFSRLILIVLLPLGLITCRRWWWFFISWPLFMYIQDFFYLLFIELNWIKESLLGFNLSPFFILPFIYYLRRRYQKSFLCLFNKNPKYDKKDLSLDSLAIWILCFSVPLNYLFLFFYPNYYNKLNFTINSLSEKDIYHFIYYFFDKLVAILLLGIWFVVSRRWWYFLLGWPILLHLFQFIDLFNKYLGVELINLRWFYMCSFTLLILFPIYKVKGYLPWDIFRDQLSKRKGFWKRFFYLVYSMEEYFIIIVSLFFLKLFISDHLIYPINCIILVFLISWFIFCKKWWYFFISLPILWYGLEVFQKGINEGIMLLVILIFSFYPIYRMRKYIYKEIMKKSSLTDRI